MMKNIKKSIGVAVLLIPFLALGQNFVTKGIKWTSNMSWDQIMEKAKEENKYVFVDCYTTWCGPCKLMDRDVYPNDSVGDFFNDKFISIRIQMDRTKNDNPFIESWYKDADEMRKHYLVESYPTFLFFSPEGKIIHKETGAKTNIKEFIGIAQTALKPGKVHIDVFQEYEKYMLDFNLGKISYNQIPEMFAVAKKIGDTISRKLLNVHEEYVSNQKEKERYTKSNIEFWATLSLGSDRKIMSFFYRDGDKIDKVMKKEGFAARQVDKCIQNVIVAPFINNQIKDSVAKSGVTTIDGSTGNVIANTTSYDEADWEKLKELIHRDFNSYFVKRNVLKAKVIWYGKNSNWIPYARLGLKSIKKYPPDFDDFKEVYKLNGICWNIFLQINDKNLLRKWVQYTGKTIEKLLNQKSWQISNYIDTYANLLYKIGQKEKAIEWQKKAVAMSPQNKYFSMALEQMIKGEATYGVQPLITKK